MADNDYASPFPEPDPAGSHVPAPSFASEARGSDGTSPRRPDKLSHRLLTLVALVALLARSWTIQRILQDATWEARAICGLIYEQKMFQKEITDEPGMTSLAVEGHMRQLRTHAKTLAARGEIDASYGRITTAKAGGQ
ncbi:hypothetical protein ACIRP3_41680 [Streptomyces sp. NPDC101209]|uniref:hypothetical protein n=1 Tax=Streptomyces sp. NPDC101209 TaxID=3366129 RepID=UPI0038308507